MNECLSLLSKIQVCVMQTFDLLKHGSSIGSRLADKRWSTSISHVPFLKLAMQPKIHKVMGQRAFQEMST